MPPRRTLALLLGVLVLAVLAATAVSRIPVPSLARIQPRRTLKVFTYLHRSLRFSGPANWTTETGSAPLVVTLGSGPALVAIWRYPRSTSQPLPADIPALERARRALIAAARARDPTFRVISSAVVGINSVPSVELDALETIRGQVRRVRSTHLYKRGVEVVVDEYAPEALFHTVDRGVFSPLLHSVRLVG